MAAPTASRDERGWALVSVLWTLTALALMAAAAQELTVTSYQSERHAMVDARAEAALDAAVARAVLGIADARPQRRWRVDGIATTFRFDGLAIRVAAQDESGRIDLNAASIGTIRQLLLVSGLAPDDAGRLADSIAAWRSATGLESLNGARDADYRAARLSYLPRHGPFQTVDELGLVLGMTPRLFDRLKPALTVYSKRVSFDASVAPREVLQVLHPNDPEKVDQILNTRTALAMPSPTGRAFAITAGVSVGRRNFRREAVVLLTGDDRRPYLVLAWR